MRGCKWCVDVLTLVHIVLDFQFQLPRMGLHSVHIVLQVLLILLVSVLELYELLLRNVRTHTQKHKQTHTKSLVSNSLKLIIRVFFLHFL